MNKRLFIVFMLGFSSGLPLALLTGTLQAWYAEMGMSVLSTGMLSLIGLPYVYRIFWGPFLDYYNLSRLGRRRSWMLLMQIILLIGFNALSFLSPNHAPKLMAVIAFILASCSATQDVAIDAHRVEYLPFATHGLGASLAIFGYRIALIIAGGMALILAGQLGWTWTYRLVGSLMLIGVFASLWSQEPKREFVQTTSLVQNFYIPAKDLLTRKEIIPLILFILFYKLGEAFTTTTSGIVMPFLIQGLGFSLDTIGYVNKIIGISATLLGGLAAGILLMKWTLNRALLAFGLMQAMTNLLFVLLAISGKNLNLLIIAVSLDNFAAGMASTALVTLFMRLVNTKFTATQFSILVAISTLPRIFSGPMAAVLQMALGWVGLYQLSFVLALGFIPFLLSLNRLSHAISIGVNEGEYRKQSGEHLETLP